MVPLAASCKARRIRIWFLSLGAVAIALAGASFAQAADGVPAGATAPAKTQATTAQAATPSSPNGPAAGTPGESTGAPDGAAGSGEGAAAAPTAQPPAAPGSATGQAAAPTGVPADAAAGAAGAAAGQDVASEGAASAAADPGASAGASGDDTAPASDPAAAQGSETPSNASPAGASEHEQETSVAQTAGAAATATQDGVGNTSVTVRVDQPGDGSPVSQENRAEGSADATTAAQTTTPATTDQTASAAAQGAQTDVQNTAVTVRVGSPGDNGAVEQANVAAATASTSVTPPGDGAATTDESAAATATQDGASNTNVSIRVFSPGSDGSVGQGNQSSAAADTSGPDGASATATQNGVQNTNVSVRVGSDGAPGAVSQQSAATATAAGAGVAVTTTQGGLDTNLSVVLDGNSLQRPGRNGLQVWVWNWNWSHDESAGTPVDIEPSSWDWSWDTTGAPAHGQQGQVTTRPASANDPAAGTWTWNWDWTRAGAPDWTWQWNRAGQLPCEACVWVWNWTWNWTGQPAQTGLTAPGRSSNTGGTPDQANRAVATAAATVTADVAQTITQDRTGEGRQYAGQLVTVQQAADAAASAAQSGVETIATADLRTPQVNRVTSYSTVTVGADLAQQVEQSMLVDDEGDAAQWSGQEIDVVQQAQANVRSGQSGVTLRAGGTSLVAGQAEATAVAAVDQRAGQEALVAAGSTDQWAGQLTLVEQTGDAASVAEQTGAAAPRFVGGTARARSGSGAFARIDQNATQDAARAGGHGAQSVMQAVYVGQDGTATATTAQHAGSTSSPATSEARATNRALVVQDGAQKSTGALSLDIQDLTQQSIVLQIGIAASTSTGGIAGTAVVSNCAIVQQTAGQSVAAGAATPAGRDLSAFCAPPAAPAVVTGAEPGVAPAAAGPPVEPVAVGVLPPDELDVELFHGHPRLSATARGARAITPHLQLVPVEPGAERPAQGSPAMTQISVPPPTQARLDTRPGEHAGAGDAGREPPLPPAGDPPSWVSALAAAAGSGPGPSGIAAILAALLLVPPVLRRAREGSVVRRPIEVLSRVDVPV